MRKTIKSHAKIRLKKTYWMMVVLCLLLAIVGINYTSSLQILNTDTSEGVEPSIQGEIVADIILGHSEESDRRVNEYLEKQKASTSNVGIVAISHSRGVLAQLVNGTSSGQLYKKIYDGIQTMTQSKTLSIVFFIFLSILFLIFVHIFFVNVFRVTATRIAMEYRYYDKVPVKRFLFLLSIRKVWNTCLTMFLTGLYSFLWGLTIVGYAIKSYSYMMVPYIIAENPDIAPNRAITLSRRMMNGHKWEAFKLKLSFLGWYILEFFTIGISGMLFSNPYKELTMAEYYDYIRTQAKEKQIPDADLLNDIYLYEKADKALLKKTYQDIQQDIADADAPIASHFGLRGFFEKIFGIVLFCDDDEKAFQAKMSKQLAVRNYKEICEQHMYPFRLFLHRHKERIVKLSSVQYNRHYSLLSLILIFFTMSIIGWCWEVSLHLVSDGTFVNRGFCHGPWLPIYGFGGVLILVVLYRFRKNILLEFLSAVVLCGCVEYFTAWFMEFSNGGTKWWDYSGYFLNIHGRICAEGLLVFGLGGLAIVYLIAPFLDNLFQRIPRKIAIVLCAVLLVTYCGDIIYSQEHPNTGKGITNYTETITTEMETEIS